MTTWWPVIGETSLMTGCALGLVWAWLSTSLRRRKFLTAAIRPIGQIRWFCMNFLSMSAYLSLVVALGLSTIHDILPVQMFWFLLGLSALAFVLAMQVPGATVQPRRPIGLGEVRQPQADPPLVPARRSA